MPTSLRLAPEFSSKLEELFRRAEIPKEWDVSVEGFARAMERSAESRFRGSQPSTREISAYFESLHGRELALATACANGNASAWDYFVAQYRPELYRAAGAIAGPSVGRDLADSLYAELYGLECKEGRRRSVFDYFHGRSKLGTWLRAILAQRHVDEIRRTRRTESLDDPESQSVELPQPQAASNSEDPDRAHYLAMLQTVLSAALAALAPRDRLRLAYYYVDDLTLAEIGRLLGEHEATVSRKLERLRRDLRAHVETELRGKKQLSDAQVRQCYEYAQQEWPFDLTRVLSAKE